MKKKTLITGGAGFLGFHLASRLARDPDRRVVLLDNLSRGRLDPELGALLELPNVSLVQGDVASRDTFARLGTGYAEVYHLAAVIGVQNVVNRPDKVVRVNALGTLHLLDWFSEGGGRKLVFASTSEAYSWSRLICELPVPTPEDVPLALTDLRNPRSSYAGSKIFGELAVTHCCAGRGLPFCIVRYHNVYGPRMGFDHVIPQLYQRALQGQDPLDVYSAEHTRAFCHIDDALEATVAAMDRPEAEGLTINVGNDREEVRIIELAGRLLQAAGLQAALRPVPAPHDPITRRCPDMGLAERVLGYRPRVDLDRGLAMTLPWYEQRLEAWAEMDGGG